MEISVDVPVEVIVVEVAFVPIGEDTCVYLNFMLKEKEPLKPNLVRRLGSIVEQVPYWGTQISANLFEISHLKLSATRLLSHQRQILRFLVVA